MQVTTSKAPRTTTNYNLYSKRIFLAGSIDMGTAAMWQDEAQHLINSKSIELDVNTCIFNPRRDHWDITWEQSINNYNFTQQVLWELGNLDFSTDIIMYFDPNSKAPISLLELGLYATSKKIYVVCPEGFYRKGNVDVVCIKYNIPQYNSLKEAINKIFENG
jgi:hypothetical protein